MAVRCDVVYEPQDSVNFKDLNAQNLKNMKILVSVNLLALFFRTFIASSSLFWHVAATRSPTGRFCVKEC